MTAVPDTVLIVDDSLTVRMDLAEAFSAAGFRTLLSASATEARQALAREPAALIILDVQLPDGDGTDLLKEFRATPSLDRVPILMLSAEADVRDRIRGLATGADDYVGKPYDTGYVIARARELLRRVVRATVGERVTVLAIDDSATFRAELRAILEGAGYAAVMAASGEEGLAIAPSVHPAVILVDGVMPGIDGPTFIRRIRFDAALRGTPCLILTADDDRGAELRALDAGADGFIRKGEDAAVVLARLAAVVRQAGPRAETASLLGPKRILAVDDRAPYLDELAEVLRSEGYDVVLAHSGEDAIAMLAAQPIDCIVLADGVAGAETCLRIKSAPGVRQIPLILLTAREDRATIVEGLTAGADDAIPRSSEVQILKARVRAQLRRKQLEDENRRIREDHLSRELDAAEARAARELAETRAALVAELERKNNELEAFSYSVSHDLRAPLRGILGFTQALLEDQAERLDDKGRDYLRRVGGATRRMEELIEDLLELSRLGRGELGRSAVNVSELARTVAEDVGRKHPERAMELEVQDGATAQADRCLLRVVFENLFGNAWKFTAKTARPRVEFGVAAGDGGPVFFVRDNGAGFSMEHAAKLFRPFQRLHNEADFPGTGIGLATVHRIIDRHGGRVWAEGAIGAGATVSFTIPAPGGRESKDPRGRNGRT